LRAALTVKDTPGLRFHLAHCEEEQGQLVEASLDYDRASELLRQGAKAPDVQKLLVPASADLKRRIPRVSVEIPSDVPNPTAQIDGKPYAPSELALGQTLNPGQHQLSVSALGRDPFVSMFTLKEGDQVSIRVELKDTPRATRAMPQPPTSGPRVPVRSASAPPAPSGNATSPKLYLMIGESAVTVAGIALAVGYSVAEASARDRIQADQSQIDHAAQGDGACGSPDSALSATCANLRASIAVHDRDVTGKTVGFVCAGVGAAALLTTWLVYPSHTQSAGLSVQPVVALGRVGLLGQF